MAEGAALRKPRIRRPALLLSALVLNAGSLQSQEPAYPHGTGPTVLVDRSHHNAGDFSQVIFEGFAPRLEEEGYRVQELTQPFDREALVDVQITIIVAPLHSRNALRSYPPTDEAQVAAVSRLPTPSAFSEDEIKVLRRWVGEGGALLLVLDHFPVPGSSQDLGAAFGIEISNGFAFDGALLTEQTVAQAMADEPQVVLTRAQGGVADDPITNGRTPGERIDSFRFWTGSAFRLPPEGRSLLTFGSSFVSLLPEVAWQFSETTPREEIGGWSGGGVLQVERGRLAIFGELGIVAGPYPEGVQNLQLFMNTLHWLSGLLD